MIKVLAADHDFLVRRGWECLLSNNTDIELAGTATGLEDLMDKMFLHQPDILIIDHTSKSFGFDAIKKVIAEYPECRILAVTGERSKQEIASVLSVGVKSYLLKECDEEEIFEAIFSTYRNEGFLCGKIVQTLENNLSESENPCQGMNVSDRELEVIRLVAEGYSNKQIADMLCLSTHTITTHRKNIMAKLQINNTAGLVLFAVKNGLIGPNKFLFSSTN